MSSAATRRQPSLLVINPNSSSSITAGLEASLRPLCPLGVQCDFYTGPAPAAPASIYDFRTGIASAQACYADLGARGAFEAYDGFLVCCFSDHGLTHMIRERLGSGSSRFCTGIFDASMTSCLLFSSGRFGVLTTGPSVGGMASGINKGVSSFLGAGASERYAGCVATGLGVLELRTEDPTRKAEVEQKIKEKVVEVVLNGAEAVILGCAGFAGMEGILEDGLKEAGLPRVRIVDGAKAGLAFLAGQLLQARASGEP